MHRLYSRRHPIVQCTEAKPTEVEGRVETIGKVAELGVTEIICSCYYVPTIVECYYGIINYY